MLYAKQSPPLQQLCRTPEAVPVSDNTVLLLLLLNPSPTALFAATCHTPMTPRSRGAITEHREQRFLHCNGGEKCPNALKDAKREEGSAALEIAVISSPKLDATFAIRLGGGG